MESEILFQYTVSSWERLQTFDKNCVLILIFCLDVSFFDLDLSEPILNVNGNIQELVDIREGKSLAISCRADARPTPNLIISKYSQMKIIEHKVSNVLDISIPEVQCSDTDIYTCTGKLAGFVSKQKNVTINILCKLFEIIHFCNDFFQLRYSCILSIYSMYILTRLDIHYERWHFVKLNKPFSQYKMIDGKIWFKTKISNTKKNSTWIWVIPRKL